MSVAGVRSSRGDGFQTLIAARYAIEMLYDSDLVEVEIESTSLDSSNNVVLVDDVVIRRLRGPNLYVQAKKNQTDFRSWSLGDLSEEISKAWLQWQREPTCKIRFVSRNEFGEIAKLQEHAVTQPTSEAFVKSLTSEFKKICDRLIVGCAGGQATVFDLHAFLLALSFESVDPDSLRSNLKGSLQRHVAHADLALKVICQRLDAISRRECEGGSVTSQRHSLTRESLNELFQETGIELCAPRAGAEISAELRLLSQVGRDWPRKIGNVEIRRAAVEEILSSVAEMTPSILLSGGSGAGKTCVLLAVVESLELSGGALPIFIQAREFSSCQSADDRAAIGLQATLLGDVARLSEGSPVVVLIDSLDVLSIGRDHNGLAFFLSLIDRLNAIPNVTVMAACRSFDLKYDARISTRTWGKIVEVGLLNWAEDVEPLLQELEVLDRVPVHLKDMLCNPRLLAIFHEIAKTGLAPSATTEQELTECYLDRVVRQSPSLGDAAMAHIGDMAAKMLDSRRLDIPRSNLNVPQDMLRKLMSAGVLIETSQRNLSFAHQTLLDVLAVAHARLNGTTLSAFMRFRAAAPFIRPTVRAFLFSLRTDDPTGFRRQVREAIDSNDIAFHLKRLVAESMAEMQPSDDDWPLLRHMLDHNLALFESLYFKATEGTWSEFFHRNWLPEIMRRRQGAWFLRHLERMAQHTAAVDSGLLSLWVEAFGFDWVDQQHLRWASSSLLDKFAAWDATGLANLFERLVDCVEEDHGSLGRPLSKFIQATDLHDELLWKYVTRRLDQDAISDHDFKEKLNCAPHVFSGESFLAERMCNSQLLLDLAIADIEAWSAQRAREYEVDRPWLDGFLNKTRYERVHTVNDMHHVDALSVLMDAVEKACLHHAGQESDWWKRNVCRLRSSRDGALRYFSISAMTAHPAESSGELAETLFDVEMLGSHRFRWEMSQLIHAAYGLLSNVEQDRLQALILALFENDRDVDGIPDKWATAAIRDLMAQIPAHHLCHEALSLIERACDLVGPYDTQPDIHGWGGAVRSPVSCETISGLSEAGLLRLLAHYPSSMKRWERSEVEHLVGGADQLAVQLSEASSRAPIRFMRLLRRHWLGVGAKYREAILGGVANHTRHRFGNLKANSGWTPVDTPEGSELVAWMLDELELHYDYWYGRRMLADALNACAEAAECVEDGDRISFLLVGCMSSADPGLERGADCDRVTTAINSTRGVATEAAFCLANRWFESGRELPILLVEQLKRCARDEHVAVRSLAVRMLPVLLQRQDELGWGLLDSALFTGAEHPWKEAYNCLYYNYYRNFGRVAPYLAIVRAYPSPEARKVWSRITALCCLAGHSDFSEFLSQLKGLTDQDAWSGAMDVFIGNIADSKAYELCAKGLTAAVTLAPDKTRTVSKFGRVFAEGKEHILRIDLGTLTAYFEQVDALATNGRSATHGIGEWLASISVVDPDYTISAAEIVLCRASGTGIEPWHGEPYTVLLTSLFREAEERELSDSGALLSRVVRLQDFLLARGVHKLEDWLRDAERP